MSTPAGPGDAYIQSPSIHGDRIAFAAEGNLWTVPVAGGVARRLTASPGLHLHPRYSPDGKWLAYSGADEGPSAVYVMPSDGGPARRLTYNGGMDAVCGWSADSSRVYFRNAGIGGLRTSTIGSVPVNGGATRVEPFGPAATIAFHPDGDRVAVNRFTFDPARWKRYSGGMVGQLWIGRLSTRQFVEVTGNRRTRTAPMWIGETLYYLSDADGMGDIWAVEASGANARRVTSHREFFARPPQSHGTRIVYAMGARLWLLDVSGGNKTPREVPVQVLGHSAVTTRKFIDVGDTVGAVRPTNDGSESVIHARGQIVRVPHWHGASRTLAALDGVRFRDAAWLGESGDSVAVADLDGEDAVVRIPAGGLNGERAKVTVLGGIGERIRTITPSPNGKRIGGIL